MQGPAVWALRAQTDKLEYAREMRRILERTPNLDIREGMAIDLEFGPNDEVTGIASRPSNPRLKPTHTFCRPWDAHLEAMSDIFCSAKDLLLGLSKEGIK